jgi:endonuclease/exonuclease/phosphatase family metal-dependent hydrolase
MTTHKTTLCPGKDYIIKSAKDLKDAQFINLVAKRARKLVNPNLPLVKTTSEREKLEGEIKQYYEKINLAKDFLPASFLKIGASKAEAICRIRTPRSLGTGFLIAPGILMTNNHVLEDEEKARESVAEFGYEIGQNATIVAIDPDRIFITSAELDFTIVGCVMTGLEDIQPIRLKIDPASITRSERVNIIQHPRGRHKEIAIHDNKVKRVKDKVIWYTTDTEPGSSGSGVFDNDWELVALHHAGWSEGNGTATNEGIKITSIIDFILANQRNENFNNQNLNLLLENLQGISPYWGFFDFYNLKQNKQLEVEIPAYTGTENFADIGVWNIEHFNNNISTPRVNAVAKVMANLAMDVFGLTEVEAGAMDKLKTSLGSFGLAMDYVLLDARGSQDIAILYDKETSSVEKMDEYYTTYSAQLDAKTPSGKTAFPRKPLFAKCEVKHNDLKVEFIFIVVHLKAFGDAVSKSRRRLAAEMLSEIIASIRENEDLPVIIGGDFNEVLTNDVLSPLQDSPDLFALTSDDANNDAISYVGARHRSLIDHIIVSNDVNMGDISGDDAAIVRLDKSVADFPDQISDHVPVVFRMIFKENDTPVQASQQATKHMIELPDNASLIEIVVKN